MLELISVSNYIITYRYTSGQDASNVQLLGWKTQKVVEVETSPISLLPTAFTAVC